MLIVEIILTIFAWRKGWKWLSLLPLVFGLFIGFLIGFEVGASGGDLNSVDGIGYIIDLLVTGILIFMVSKRPKSKVVNPENTTILS